MVIQQITKSFITERFSTDNGDDRTDVIKNNADKEAIDQLDSAEYEIVEYFVHLVRVLGLPKSIGEIYGLLFCSSKPLMIQEIMKVLSISKGSTSQGLRFLGNINAIQITKKFGVRSDYYSAEINLRKLLSGFLGEQIEPHLKNGHQRIDRISQAVGDLPEGQRSQRKFLIDRVKVLKSWNNKSSKLLPLLVKIVGSK